MFHVSINMLVIISFILLELFDCNTYLISHNKFYSFNKIYLCIENILFQIHNFIKFLISWINILYIKTIIIINN